jgi:DNA topoisomerase-1
MNLVIVESPTKAKTINRYLGKDYKVVSSFGHVRDLPKKNIGIDLEKNYKPTYSIPQKSNKALGEIKDIIQKFDIKKVILAPDEDREGEAIAHHLKWIISRYAKDVKFERITFHEITKTAIQNALKNPREIDANLFDAQQARRVLDRLVGYKLSPLLWRKIRYGLSAGRVQSVALRLIVEREREREAFKSDEYWKIKALLFKKEAKIKKMASKIIKKEDDAQNLNQDIQDKKDLQDLKDLIEADLMAKNAKKYTKLGIKSEKEVKAIHQDLEKAEYTVTGIEKKEVKKYPSPPFKTSTLQREAANKLGFSAKKTMMTAQKLYEGIKLEKGQTGLITYMRTDSLNIAYSALTKAKTVVEDKFGKDYSLEKPRYFTNKTKGAQEAHEAIRPTFPKKDPASIKKYLKSDEFKLYNLIWTKFIACQMKEALFDKAKVKIKAKKAKNEYDLEANGSQIKFKGFLLAYGQNFKIEEKELPEIAEQEELNLRNLVSTQHFTQPPARFNDASLIKALEEKGIGRPSTYAPTLSTIVDRGYVEKDESRQYQPQEVGYLVNDLMVEHFPKIVDYEFTAQMENFFDEIALGKSKWVKVIDNFYKPFAKELKEKEANIKKYEKKTDKKCPECGKNLMEKYGRFGKFYACSGYPDCKYTEDPNQKQKDKEKKALKKQVGEVVCDKCGAKMEVKHGRFGAFLGCSNYPECKNIKRIENSSGVTCPKCNKGEIVERKGRRGVFWACNNYPECRNIVPGKPTGKKCKKCKDGIIVEDLRTGKQKCSNKECK